MVTYLPKLHKDIHYAKEIAIIQGLFCFITIDVFIIKKSLSSR